MSHLSLIGLLPQRAYFDVDGPWFALDAATVLIFAVLAVWLGSPLVQAIFRRVDRPRATSVQSRQRDGDVRLDEALARPSIIAAGMVLRGGTWIGGLERLAIYASLLTGWREGIAVVVAIKGLARYSDLTGTTSAVAERFIIGTFVSVLFAAACAGAAWAVASLT